MESRTFCKILISNCNRMSNSSWRSKPESPERFEPHQEIFPYGIILFDFNKKL